MDCKRCGEEYPEDCCCAPLCTKPGCRYNGDSCYDPDCGCEKSAPERAAAERIAAGKQKTQQLLSASALLGLAAECMKERGQQYETDPNAPAQERSMERIVQAFNAVSGKGLTVREGWLFMVVLKLVRMRASPNKLDNYVDAVAYAALLGDASELS